MSDASAIAFTRGGEGAPDTRGLSLVERHAEARARAAEEATLARLHASFGGSGSSKFNVPMSVLALAASASSSAGPEAAATAEVLVREFLQEKGRELEALVRRHSSRTTSTSEDDDSSSDDDDDDERGQKPSSTKSRKKRSSSSKHSSKEDKKKKKKHYKRKEMKRKKKKRSRSRKRSSSSSDDDGSGSDDDGGDKRKKKTRATAEAATATAKTAALTSQYGLHGLLRAENPHDAERKRSEFCCWCLEVKKIQSLESLARWEENELWKTFVEDFNTATLPSDKYYDLDAWQRRKKEEEEAAKKKKGKKGDDSDDEKAFSAVDDEAARRREERQRKADEAAERLKEAYNALKYSDAGKKEDMKRQEMLKIELRQAAKTGDKEKVAKLQKLLAPEKPK